MEPQTALPLGERPRTRDEVLAQAGVRIPDRSQVRERFVARRRTRLGAWFYRTFRLNGDGVLR
jgi:hypothetical protein